MKMQKILLAFALLLSSLSSAQITITQESMPDLGSVQVSYSAVPAPVLNVGSAGVNQSWNVPQTEVTLSESGEFVSPVGTPYFVDFSTATHCFTNGVYYSYFRIDASGYYTLGWEGSGLSDIYESERLELPFPATYNTSWTSVSRRVDASGGLPITFIDSSVSAIDGWGTMTTQFGSFQVLRVASQDFAITHRVLPPPMPPMITTTSYYRYEWLTVAGLTVASMTSSPDETNPDFTEGYMYFSVAGSQAAEPVRSPVADNFSLGQNYPNPFNPTTSLPISLEKSGTVEITIYNELGEVVSSETRNFSPGEHTVGLDGSAWASGNYFAQVKADGQLQTKRMSLVK